MTTNNKVTKHFSNMEKPKNLEAKYELDAPEMSSASTINECHSVVTDLPPIHALINVDGVKTALSCWHDTCFIYQ